MKNKIVLSFGNIVILFFALIALNFIATKINIKLDFTKGSLYTLSEGSKNIVKNIDEEVTIKLFFSSSIKNLPLMVKNYGTRVAEILEEFADQSSNLTLEVIDPKPDSDEELMATKYGISGVKVGEGDDFFLGVAVLYEDEVHKIPFFDPRKEAFLEYDIALLLSKLNSKDSQTIGMISGVSFGAPSMPFQGNAAGAQDQWMFKKELEKKQKIRILEKTIEEIPTDIDILLVFHPQNFSPKTEYAIDQFIMAGGKSVLMVDPSATTVPDNSNPQMTQFMGPQSTKSNLPMVFKTLDVEFNPSSILVDSKNGAVVNTQMGPKKYPVWLSFNESGFNTDFVVTGNLKNGLFIEAGYFKLKKDTSHKLTALVSSSKESGKVDARSTRALINDPEKYDKLEGAQVISGLIQGKFKSAFSNKPKDSQYSKAHISSLEKEGTVLVIADVDFVNNQYALNALNFFGQTILQPKNHNVAFLQNSLEFIAGNPELISIRSRGTFSRPFIKVAEIQSSAQKKWQGVEKELTQKVQQLQQKLNSLQSSKTQGNQLALSDRQQKEIAQFKLEQLEVKRKRREVRKSLRQDIEGLGHMLMAINMFFVPLIILILGVIVYRKRVNGIPILKGSK